LRLLAYAYHAAFLAFMGGPIAVLLGAGRVGAYVMLAGFGVYHLAHRTLGVVGARLSGLDPWPFGQPLGNWFVGAGYALTMALLLGGLFIAMAGARVGAYLLLAGLGLQLTGDLAFGLLSYRNTMQRPWPQVAPLTDDDW
jgi:hypothetical protein